MLGEPRRTAGDARDRHLRPPQRQQSTHRSCQNPRRPTDTPSQRCDSRSASSAAVGRRIDTEESCPSPPAIVESPANRSASDIRDSPCRWLAGFAEKGSRSGRKPLAPTTKRIGFMRAFSSTCGHFREESAEKCTRPSRPRKKASRAAQASPANHPETPGHSRASELGPQTAGALCFH